MNSTPHLAHQKKPRSQDRALALQELREHIGSYLSRCDLGALCQASRRWHRDWNPVYWKDVHQPKDRTVDFASNGHLIRSLELTTTKQPVLSAIRDYCHHLRHLKLTSYKLTPEMFKECIMGLPPTAAAETVQAQETSVQANPKDIPPALEPCFYKSAYLSNSLRTLNLRMEPEVCEIMLPWLTRAKKAGHLQGLRSFTVAPAVITYTCIMMDPEPERFVKLSDIYAFLDAFPALTALSTGDMKIINENKEAPTYQRTELQVYPSISSLQLHVEHDALFEDVASRIPNVTKLSVYLAGSSNIIPAIRQHYPGLKMLAVDMSSHSEYYRPFADEDIEGQRREFKDWIDLFQGLPHLESLSTRYTSLPWTVMESLAKSCPRLEQLRFGYNTFLSVLGLKSLLRSCTRLKSIHVEDQALSASIVANDDLWKSPVETLYLDQVLLKTEQDMDNFRRRIRLLPTLRSLTFKGCSCLSARVLLEPQEYALASAGQTSNPNTDTDAKATRERDEATCDGAGESKRAKEMDISFSTIAYPNLENLSIEWFKGPLFSDSTEAFSTMLDHMPCLRYLVLDRDYTEEDLRQVRRRHVPG
ncbi:hypothetical protein BGZ70_003268 [Mortierella alpina]|uniref:F-box domain-containing protein n=1 Tax=Mortierella alpina TaxID=64518 RepID=A0A9P6JB99_MORAP|nr:hypothetical protein BGZ70_003268 [Mortierella alpina]